MSEDGRKDQYTVQNPVTQYPQPPFPQQPQEAPGTVHKMVPQPDHGETTYRGSGRPRTPSTRGRSASARPRAGRARFTC